jgi:hypothetical protein
MPRLREGKKGERLGSRRRRSVAVAGNIDKKKLLERARSREIEKRVRASTAEFRALQNHATPGVLGRHRNWRSRSVFRGRKTRAPGQQRSIRCSMTLLRTRRTRRILAIRRQSDRWKIDT